MVGKALCEKQGNETADRREEGREAGRYAAQPMLERVAQLVNLEYHPPPNRARLLRLVTTIFLVMEFEVCANKAKQSFECFPSSVVLSSETGMDHVVVKTTTMTTTTAPQRYNKPCIYMIRQAQTRVRNGGRQTTSYKPHTTKPTNHEPRVVATCALIASAQVAFADLAIPVSHKTKSCTTKRWVTHHTEASRGRGGAYFSHQVPAIIHHTSNHIYTRANQNQRSLW